MTVNERIAIDGREFLVVPDGPVCNDDYRAAGVRVVHILKEATKSLGLGPALLEYVRSNGTVKWRLWKVTARRSYALQNGLPEWPALPEEAFGAALRASAILNLNDTIPPGEEKRFRSEDDEVLKMAKARWPARRQVLEALEPSVVVCGGTFGLMRSLLAESGETCRECDGYFVWKGIPFVYAYHPSFNSKSHSVEYEEFRERCRRIIAKGA